MLFDQPLCCRSVTFELYLDDKFPDNHYSSNQILRKKHKCYAVNITKKNKRKTKQKENSFLTKAFTYH